MNASRIVNQLPTHGSGGNCCILCGCLPCMNLSFLRTREGVVKLLQIILGSFCESLLISQGPTYSVSLGSSYYSFLTAASTGLTTSLILLLTYVISSKSVTLVRQSLFEIIFNGTICFLHISSSSYLVFALYTFLYPIHKITSLFQVYPAMSMSYITGFALGILYGYDSWLTYKRYH